MGNKGWSTLKAKVEAKFENLKTEHLKILNSKCAIFTQMKRPTTKSKIVALFLFSCVFAPVSN